MQGMTFSLFPPYSGAVGTEAQSGAEERAHAGRTGALQEMLGIAASALAQRILQQAFAEVTFLAFMM